jgi:hypothetical protein
MGTKERSGDMTGEEGKGSGEGSIKVAYTFHK